MQSELPFKTGESSTDHLACSDADRAGKLGRVDDHDLALEFPGGDEVSSYPPPTQRCVASPSPPPASTTRTTVFRLIRLHSTILSRSKRVAVLDGNPEVSIGRDVAPTARVRLKEMAVSKFHASIYWDGMRHQWGIVDMGSMHGTFVRSAQDALSTVASSLKYGTRLSETRKSSMPRMLRHLDEITVGGTTFLVHEHTTGRPCPQCATDGTTEIPLYPVRKETSPKACQSQKRKRSPDLSELHPKRALSQLKNSLLSRHAAEHSSSTLVYKDRSALRRELHPEHLLPPLPSTLHTDANLCPTFPTSQITFETLPPPDPPAALPSSNIGHKLLIQQGWSPGTALGERPEDGLVEPIHISVNSSRAGLGASISVPSRQMSEDWREQAKQRRWEYLQGR